MISSLRKILSFATMAFASLAISTSSTAQTIIVNGTSCSGNWSASTVGTTTTLTLPSSCLGGCTNTGAPTISSIAPASGPIGTQITITGTNLCGATSVTVGGSAATNVSSGATTATATVAAGAGGTVSVTTSSGTATSTQQFTVTVSTAPAITSIAPPNATPGTAITIYGANFALGATLAFGTTPAVVTSIVPTAITTVIPAGIAAGPVTVTVNVGGQTAQSNYTVGGSGGGTCPSGNTSVEGVCIPVKSKEYPGQPAALVPGVPAGGAGPYMNAYAIDGVATKCAIATPAIARLWWHNIDFAQYQSSGAPELPLLQAGEAMTWKFTAPASGTNFFTYDSGGDGLRSPAFMSVSQSPCDFDSSKVAAGNACYRSGQTVGMYWIATNGNAASYECKLVPGQTYYVNLRMQDARPAVQGGSPTTDFCAGKGQACGGSVQIR